MARVQLALNVDDLDEAITFYSKLFNTAPAKAKPGYANFAIDEPPLKLVLLENPGHGGTLNHLGVEVASGDTCTPKSTDSPMRACSPTKSSTPPAVLPPKTRLGSPAPEVNAGRSTPS
jgi:catechol 2,3-dioxygenase-like lactoylglutathione lyase family enzyme